MVASHARIVKEFVGVGNRAPRPLCRIRRSGQWQVRERLGDAAVDTDVLGVRIKRAEQPLKNRLNKEKRGVLPYTNQMLGRIGKAIFIRFES